MTIKRVVAMAAALGLVAVLIWFLNKAPAVPAVSGTSLSGQAVSTEGLKGRPYLVNFWATSCVTCVKEMPDLIALHQQFSGRGFEVVAVAMAYDVPEYLSRFVQERNLPFQVVHDLGGEWASGFGDIRVTPTTFLVDANGQLLKRYVGVPDFNYLKRWLEQALPARPHDKTTEPARPPQHAQTRVSLPPTPAI
ncbi:MAG: hypothetical protein RLZZ290_649 [Pseudomonadota bacterium]|jgi:thiol-disulfide isomerase/thioredoxin